VGVAVVLRSATLGLHVVDSERVLPLQRRGRGEARPNVTKRPDSFIQNLKT